jgi:hypothetical protein
MHARVLLGLEQVEQLGLVFQVRAGRIAEAHAHAAVLRLEFLPDRHLGRIADAPHAPYSVMKQLGKPLGRLHRDGLQRVRAQIFSRVSILVRQFPYAGPAGHHEHGDVVALSWGGRANEIGQTEAFAAALAGEFKARQRALRRR